MGHSEFAQNPYSHYQELLQHGSIHWLEKQQAWLVLGFHDIQKVLQNPNAFSSQSEQPFDPVLLNADAPEHTTRRSSIAGTKGLFSNNRIHNGYTQNQAIAKELITSLGSRPKIDLISDLAAPYSSMVMLNLLNLQPESVSELMQWSQETVHSKALYDHEYSRQMWERFKPHVEQMVKRNLSDNKSLGLGEMLRDAEGLFPDLSSVIDLVKILLLGGHETTPNLVGSCLYRLLQNDKFWLEEWQNGRVSLEQIIRETLRIDAPTQLIHRTCVEDTQFGKITISNGERLILSLGAANRDATVFEGADSFRPQRTEKQILSFGYGPHYCIGAQLALQETEILITELFGAFEELELSVDDTPVYRPSSHIRGFKHLPLWLNANGRKQTSSIHRASFDILQEDLEKFGHWPSLEQYPSQSKNEWTYTYPSPFIHANVLLSLSEFGLRIPSHWISQGVEFLSSAQESGIWRFWPLETARNPVPPDMDDLALCSLALKQCSRDPEHYNLIQSQIRPTGEVPTWLWPNTRLLVQNWRLWLKLVQEQGAVKPTIQAGMLHPSDWELNVMLNILAYCGAHSNSTALINRCIQLWDNEQDPAHFYNNRWVTLYHFSRCYHHGINAFAPLLNKAIPELEALMEEGDFHSKLLGGMIAKYARLTRLHIQFQNALLEDTSKESFSIEAFPYFTSKNRAYCGGSRSLTAALLLQVLSN